MRRRSPTTDARPPKTDRHHRPAAKKSAGLALVRPRSGQWFSGRARDRGAHFGADALLGSHWIATFCECLRLNEGDFMISGLHFMMSEVQVET